MNASPLFTIIIPTFNRAKLLRIAINSVLDQQYKNWELIIVDDGSTDDTKKVVQSFIGLHDNIQYFFQENKERSVARNLGIEKAKGQYLCFLDDDDYFLPNHLWVIQEEINIQKDPVAIFRTGMITKQGDKNTYSPFYNPRTDKNPVLFFLNNMVGMHTLAFHKDILQETKFDPRWFHFQDTHLLIRCLLKFQIHQIENYTAVYMRYPDMGSLKIFTMENAEARTENNVAAIKDLFKQTNAEIYKYVPQSLEKRLVAQKYLGHANGALYMKNKVLAKKLFFRSLEYGSNTQLLWQRIKFLLKYLLSLFF